MTPTPPDPRAPETALSREQAEVRLIEIAIGARPCGEWRPEEGDIYCQFCNCSSVAHDDARAIHDILAALAASLAPLADAREMLAALAHEQWTGWMRYLFSRTTPSGDGALIPAQWVTRWQHQMDTPYERLSERDKDSDRKEADRVLAIIAAPGTGTCGECAHWVAAAHTSHLDMCCLNPKAMAYQRVTTPRDGCPCLSAAWWPASAWATERGKVVLTDSPVLRPEKGFRPLLATT